MLYIDECSVLGLIIPIHGVPNIPGRAELSNVSCLRHIQEDVIHSVRRRQVHRVGNCRGKSEFIQHDEPARQWSGYWITKEWHRVHASIEVAWRYIQCRIRRWSEYLLSRNRLLVGHWRFGPLNIALVLCVCSFASFSSHYQLNKFFAR